MSKTFENATSGVGYYNKENKENIKNKENEENIYRNGVPSFPDKENICLSDRSGLASLSASQTSLLHDTGTPDAIGDSTGVPETVLNSDMINRAVIQLFDNGPKSRQRFKLRVRFNLVDKENPEFIAAVSQDMRNFKKYIPAECYDDIVEMARTLRIQVKEGFGDYPYIGKFHFNNGWSTTTQKGYIQIEPHTFAGAWFDTHHQGWDCFVKVYDWFTKISLSNEYLTDAQKKKGVIAQAVWSNPKYNTIERPKTWAQRRLEANK